MKVFPDGFFGKFDPMIREGTGLITELRETNRLVQQLLRQQLAPATNGRRVHHKVT